MNKKTKIAKKVFMTCFVFFLLYIVFIIFAKTAGGMLGATAIIFFGPSLIALFASPFILIAMILSGFYWLVNKNKEV